ncbi:hypothetical protein PRN20_20160 [Devosia sp. ZB163]|uniref:hypothetical protein n=1 Tax=Devosia sp. ZB163 TaxID=3025938 RepID=UPI00236306B0|nr:hypothetical protein [Devosia sp. ZB163]MDC9826057.1 hypothetical protein [Devosia sp. ZB163]
MALEREKALFISRNEDRCSHLLVRFGPDKGDKHLVITAAFAFDEARVWHQVQTEVPADDLRREAGPDHALIAAFGELDDGISTARIARLFAPLNVARRMAAGRT